jgi:tRNA1(Val) A37 N6-methylase TrmN6
VAGLKPSDVVLEPSAGNGGLAVWAKAIGAEVHVNEISERRQKMLEAVGFDKPTAHDGEIINSLLDQKIKPTVVLMNPPFSASTLKSYEAKNRNQYGFNHVDSGPAAPCRWRAPGSHSGRWTGKRAERRRLARRRHVRGMVR